MDLLLAMVVIVFASAALLLREAWRARQPARRLVMGRYGDARAAADRTMRSWLRIFPSVRLSSAYVTAAALHFEGDLEGSLAKLEPLAGSSIRSTVCALEAANLVLLDRDLPRAKALLEEIPARDRTAEDLLLVALVDQALGRDPVSIGTIPKTSDRRREAIHHLLRGLFLLRADRTSEAQPELEIAARNPITNVYVERARKMLTAPSTPSEIDGPSSLAPQVVAAAKDP